MQVRGLLVAVVLLALLGAGVYWSDRQKSAEEAKEASGDATKLIHIKDEAVRKMEIQRREAPPLVLERDGSNQWQMRAPETWRVDQEAAGQVASTYVGLAYDRVLDEKATDLASYGLADPAVTLTATTKDGKTAKLLMGDESPTGTGVFAKLGDDPRVFLVPLNAKTSIDKSPADVRDKRLLVFEQEKLTRLELASKTGPVEFGRNAQNEWQIVRPKPQRADNSKVDELIQKLAEARMDTSLPAEEAARFPSGFAGGTRVGTASVTDASGTKTLEVRKRGEDYYARSSSEPGVYKIAKETGESLDKTLDDFRNKKLFDFGFSDPSSVSLKDNEKSYVFRKTGENWANAAGKQMDATSVQSFIDKLRDLTATRFVEYGFTTPVIEIAVTSNEGKRNEKVLISKAANAYFARRDSEPGITYELDTNAVEEMQRAAGDVKEPPPPPKK
jgi:hypothetical protein